MSKLRRETVTIRDEPYLIREWTPAERSEFFKRVKADPTLGSAYIAFRCTLKDETGAPLWPKEKDVTDGEVSTEVCDEINKAIMKLSGVDLDAAKKDADSPPKD